MQPSLLPSSDYEFIFILFLLLFFVLFFGLFTGLIFGLFCGLAAIGNGIIKPMETISWNYKNVIQKMIHGLIYALGIGITLGLILGLSLVLILWLDGITSYKPLMFGITIGLILGLNLGLFIALISGINIKEISIRNKPNQGITESATNAAFSSIAMFLLTIILLWGISRLLPIREIEWSSGLRTGLFSNICFGLGYGGMAVIQHYTLRFLLWRSGATPLNYVDFLNYATERRLLQRVGGRYRFLHDLLREHLANSHEGDEK